MPKIFYFLKLCLPLAILLGSFSILSNCGSSGSSSTTGSTTSGSNIQAISVNSDFPDGYTNELLTTVTVCVPGTSTCQTIPDILVDTGSSGLRLISSVLTVSLPLEKIESNPVGECEQFVSSIVWGPMAIADVKIADEKASSIPIQIIGSSSFTAPPQSCFGRGLPEDNTVASLGANGILGIGPLAYDCGSSCTQDPSMVPALYYSCPDASECQLVSVPLENQTTNPVFKFLHDNNGVMISLPSVDSNGAASVSGNLIFGIGTRSNNTLGAATIITTDATAEFGTSFNGTNYRGVLDTGTNVLEILNSKLINVPQCSSKSAAGSQLYCPPSTVTLDFTVTGNNNSTSIMSSLDIADANTLVMTGNAAFSNLAGPYGFTPEIFILGLPYFYGRDVFIGIEGQKTSSVVGPFVAY